MFARKLVVLAALAMLAAVTGHITAPAADELVADDEELLKKHGIGITASDLVDFLRNQILTDADRKSIEQLVIDLGSDKFGTREAATRRLISLGSPAVPYLKKAAESPDLEVKSRAEKCLAELSQGTGLALRSAAVRLIAHRRPADGLPLLLDYFPHADDELIEEEILRSAAILGIRDGKADPLLLEAIRDPMAGRRAAAVCILARSGGPEHRAAVRQRLADPNAKVRLHAAHGLLGDRFPRTSEPELADDDLAILQRAKLADTPAALVEFFRRRTLNKDDIEQIAQLIKQLDSDRFRDREEASRRLIDFGPGALEQLRQAAKGSALEVTRRVELCIETITCNPGPALPLAALRVLARRPAADAIPVLLGYVPFADDSRVEEEVHNTLAILSIRAPAIDPALVAALKDPHPARRAVAALVLGRVGEQSHCTAIRPLLKDADTRVRLHAARGLLAARDRTAVDTLLALLPDVSGEQLAEIEAILQLLAGERAPPLVLDGTPESRRRYQEAWQAWWRDQGPGLDLPHLDLGHRQLGLSVVAELIGNNANGNRVWEFGADGKPRWELFNLQGPIDACVLRNGRVLVAEHNAQRVTEREIKGEIKWECKVAGNPVACQRLPNGNTFIATYNQVLEVKPDGSILYQHNPNAGIGGVIYDGYKATNGQIIVIGGRGTILEIDSGTGKQLHSIQVGQNGGWGGVSPLPGGRFLVAMMNPGVVREVDRSGTPLWEAKVQQACHAVRLPSGNTLVACMNIQKIVEVNRAGNVVREISTTGRPFHIRRR